STGSGSMRTTRARRWAAPSGAPTCARCRAPSPPARARCSATSSPRAGSACRAARRDNERGGAKRFAPLNSCPWSFELVDHHRDTHGVPLGERLLECARSAPRFHVLARIADGGAAWRARRLRLGLGGRYLSGGRLGRGGVLSRGGGCSGS